MRRISSALTEGPIASTLVMFSLPILAGNILQSLNGSVNAIWVGNYLGEAALTATSNSNTIMFLLLACVFGVSLASTILIAQHLGAGRDLEAKRAVGASATFFALIAVAVAVIGFLVSDRLLLAMRTPADAFPLAHDYLRIIFVAIPFMFMYAYVVAALRGGGDSKTPFAFLAISVALDIVLNPLLIFGIGPFPKLGIAGSAYATLIANASTLTALLIYLYRRRHPLCLHKGEFHLLRIDGAITATLIRKGVPMGLQMVVAATSGLLMLSLINGYGTQTTAGFAASMQLWSYLQMPAFAISAAVSSMAAQNVGAGRWDRVGQTARAGILFQCVVTGATVLLILVFSRQALGIFLPASSASLDIAQHMNLIVSWSFILFGVAMVLFGVVRSTGAVIVPLLILIVTLWLVRFPVAAVMSDRFGADAIWWSFPLSSLLAMVCTVWYYKYGNWRSAKMSSPGSAASEPVG